MVTFWDVEGPIEKVEVSCNLILLRMRTAPRFVVEGVQNLVTRVSKLVCSQLCLALASVLLVPDHQQGEMSAVQNLDLLCFRFPVRLWVLSAFTVGGCVCTLVVVVGLTLGGTSLCGSSSVKHVLAFAPRSGNWRTVVQTPSDEYGEMGREENLF